MEAVLAREVEAPLEVAAAALDLARHQVRRADRVERERLDVGVVDLTASSRPRVAPAHALGVVAAQHAQVALDRVRERELAAGRQLLEDLDRLAARLLGGVVQAERDRRRRQPRQVLAEPEPVVERSCERDRLLSRLERLGVAARQRRLASRSPRGATSRSRSVGGVVAQRAGVLLGRLAVRTDRRGARARPRREAQDGLGVPGRVGVMGEALRSCASAGWACECARTRSRSARSAGRVSARARSPGAPARAGTRAERPTGSASRRRGTRRGGRSRSPASSSRSQISTEPGYDRDRVEQVDARRRSAGSRGRARRRGPSPGRRLPRQPGPR